MSGRALGVAALVAAAAAVAAGCGGGSEPEPSRSAGAVPAGFVGIVSEDAFAQTGGPGYRRAQLAAQRRAGIGLIRQTFSWRAIEQRPGRYELATYDRFVLDAARAGLRVLPILFDTPAFRAAPVADGDRRAAAPPRDPAAMARFAVALQHRYGPGGTLWRAHPGVPVRPITAWQIWNEPNLPVYWAGKPDARQYVELLRVVGAALHRADPHAEVVTAGLPESRLGVPFARYLKAMYAAGAAGTFDTLAVNAYSRRVTGMVAAVLGARRILSSAGQGDVPIRVTEFGWATSGPHSSMTVGPKTQARLVKTAVRTLAARRERLKLRGVVYYAWRDARPYPGGRDFWGLHTGLVTRGGKAKPALRALGEAAGEASPRRWTGISLTYH